MKRFLYEDQDVILKNEKAANVVLYWDENFYMIVEPEEGDFNDSCDDKETIDICVEMFGPYNSLDMVNKVMHYYCKRDSWYEFE